MYRRLVEEGYDVTVNHQKKTGYIAAAESNPTGWTLRRAPITTTLISARLCREGKKLRARAPMRRGVRREKLQIHPTEDFPHVPHCHGTYASYGQTLRSNLVFPLNRHISNVRALVVEVFGSLPCRRYIVALPMDLNHGLELFPKGN